jgi:hypothetical protein
MTIAGSSLGSPRGLPALRAGPVTARAGPARMAMAVAGSNLGSPRELPARRACAARASESLPRAPACRLAAPRRGAPSVHGRVRAAAGYHIFLVKSRGSCLFIPLGRELTKKKRYRRRDPAVADRGRRFRGPARSESAAPQPEAGRCAPTARPGGPAASESARVRVKFTGTPPSGSSGSRHQPEDVRVGVTVPRALRVEGSDRVSDSESQCSL